MERSVKNVGDPLGSWSTVHWVCPPQPTGLRGFKQWCKENKHHRLKGLFYRLNVKLRGYDNDYGVHGNSIRLNQFFSRAMWRLWRQLNQRSQRKRYNWKGFNELLEQFQIE